MKGHYLENLGWPEAESLIKQDRVVVLPLGAASKQHGLHLPLNTDALTAQYLADRIAEQHDVIILPLLTYGYYPAFVEYPGSISLQKKTFEDTVIQIFESLHQQGADKFYVLNTGISTHWGLEPARLSLLADGVTMDYSDFTTMLEDLERDISEQPLGSHADEMETSMMLFMYPDKVQQDKAVPELTPRLGPGPFTRDRQAERGIISPSGCWGDPTLATREKGEAIIRTLVERIGHAIEILASDACDPPPPRTEYLG